MKRASEEDVAYTLTLFPGLEGRYRNPSPATRDYNCLAWVLGDTKRRWWVDGSAGQNASNQQDASYWPRWAPKEDSLTSFLVLLERFGYAQCPDGSWEPGYEKVAIYTTENARHGGVSVEHFARQTKTPGWWTSKLGRLIDVEHSLEALDGAGTGQATCFVKRSIPAPGKRRVVGPR